ncbi:hypothetical protein EAG_15494 [Camponotus floridanus]|uniref:Uncharacterized protein n=1 Tax=Camponotus floridanus TaxID=104421 RepID=E2AK90_CAMFO|nr:hypothetical protein EAG_15494 [Camponotus floridanus]
MNFSISATILCVLVVALLSETAYIGPPEFHLSRYRRLSDQRLAELETMMGLQNVKGVVVPVAFGKIDPAVVLSMLESRGSNLADFSSYEPKAISSLAQGSYSFPVKSRQKRLSDQRRAELETLVSLSRITGKRSLNVTDENGPTWQLDPVKIGRRKRFAAQIPVSIHHVKKLKRGGDPAYPLVR